MTYTEAVGKALNSDASGFDFLYNSTKNNKFYLALKYVKNEEAAKDVLQDAYIRAWKNLDKLKEPEKFDSWLSQIVVNTAKNELEKRNHTPLDLRAESGDEEDDTEIFDRAVSSWDNIPELEYTKEETRQLVHELIDSLSDEQRLVVIAFELEGLTTKEIAEQLGCSEATVKSRLRYGRNNIKEKAEELQKKGYKLYSISPVILLLFLLKKEQKIFVAEASTETALLQCQEQILKNANHTKTSNAYTAAKAGTNNIFLGTKAGKILIGIVATTVVGGAAAGIIINNSNKDSGIEVVQQTRVEDTIGDTIGDTTGNTSGNTSEDAQIQVSDGKDPYFNYEKRFDLGEPGSFGVSGYYNYVELEHIAEITGEKIKNIDEDMKVNSVRGYIMLYKILYKERGARAAELPSDVNEYTLSPKDYYDIPNGTIAHVKCGITIPAEHILGVGAKGYTVTVYKVTIDGDTGYVLQNAFNGSPAEVNPLRE
ncbi:MAG: RNA polymerase sigma factor [Lachnospira sp.]